MLFFPCQSAARAGVGELVDVVPAVVAGGALGLGARADCHDGDEVQEEPLRVSALRTRQWCGGGLERCGAFSDPLVEQNVRGRANGVSRFLRVLVRCVSSS